MRGYYTFGRRMEIRVYNNNNNNPFIIVVTRFLNWRPLLPENYTLPQRQRWRHAGASFAPVLMGVSLARSDDVRE